MRKWARLSSERWDLFAPSAFVIVGSMIGLGSATLLHRILGWSTVGRADLLTGTAVIWCFAVAWTTRGRARDRLGPLVVGVLTALLVCIPLAVTVLALARSDLARSEPFSLPLLAVGVAGLVGIDRSLADASGATKRNGSTSVDSRG
jgi:hypothetical protein